MRRTFGAVVALLVAVALSVNAQDKVELRLRLQKGQTFEMRIDNSQKISQTIQGQNMEMTQRFALGSAMEVTDVDEAGASMIKTTYTSVLFKQTGPMGTTEYDSANPPEEVPLAARAWAALLGQSFAMKLAPDGSVLEVQGTDAMVQKMVEAMELPEGPIRETVLKQLRDQFGDEAMKTMMENTMRVYPEGPVGPGDSWTRKVVVSKGFPLVVENTWTLKERKDGLAHVDILSTISPNKDAPPMQAGPMSMRVEFAGSQSGTMAISEDTGMIQHARMAQKFGGTITLQRGEQKQSWPIQVTGEVAVDTVKR